MLRFRPDLDQIPVYRPGLTHAEVMESHGVDNVVKLSSNECHEVPMLEVQKVVADVIAGVHRYPDTRKLILRDAIGDHHDVSAESVWCGGAANELTLVTSLAMGGPGTSAVFADPSFGLYRIGSIIGHSRPIAVPLDERHRHDLDAMLRALADDTTVVFVCNPNNPSGTVVDADALTRFLDEVPDDVLVVVDEAYTHYADDPAISVVDQAVDRPNLMVTRTFSKVYGLAGLRVGYAVSRPETIEALARLQLPFSVTDLAQAAATEALRHQDQVAARAEHVKRLRRRVESELDALGVPHSTSQANFVYASFGDRVDEVDDQLLAAGVVVRKVAPAGWLRITIGTLTDTDALISALHQAMSASTTQ